ncbi:MAG: hypothetical protein KBG28_26140 [Kofleriaceae bacterium]|nr:hypothetical protein [Kofleriaceae bacterium]MBP6836563.1 hypothetical protein [Kofleriaceae bacterium]MBP9207475.1 hypothetical protein [Kofleriaceae bacterium]
MRGLRGSVAAEVAAIFVLALVNLVTGLVFAAIAGDRVRADGPFASPAFPLVALHAGGVVSPLALYMYLAHAEWSWLYLIDPDRVPGLAAIPLMVAHGGLVIVGWYVGAWVQRRAERRRMMRIALGVSAGLLVLVLALTWPRLTSSATFAGYARGATVGLFVVELGYALLVALLALGGSITYVAVELSRDGRRARSR